VNKRSPHTESETDTDTSTNTNSILFPFSSINKTIATKRKYDGTESNTN